MADDIIPDPPVTDCAHQWQRGRSDFMREHLQTTMRWADYEYCPLCCAFREKP